METGHIIEDGKITLRQDCTLQDIFHMAVGLTNAPRSLQVGVDIEIFGIAKIMNNFLTFAAMEVELQ